MRQRGFLAGVQIYVALGVLALIAGLGAAVWGYRHKAAAAEARLHEVVGQRDRAIATAKANEEAALRFKQLNEALSEAVAEREKRAQALEVAKRKIKGELDALKATLPQADKDCLDRGIPPALDLRLRDDGSPADTGGAPKSPARTADPVQ